jgi:hypothetical protein
VSWWRMREKVEPRLHDRDLVAEHAARGVRIAELEGELEAAGQAIEDAYQLVYGAEERAALEAANNRILADRLRTAEACLSGVREQLRQERVERARAEQDAAAARAVQP